MAAPPPTTRASDWRATVRAFALEHFKNPAWGYSHCVRDYALARELAAADHLTLDDDVLFAAAYLHDMAAFKPWEDERLDHSDVAAGIVDTVLEGTGFPMAKIDAVRGAIRTHMYYRNPAGPEALYLHDADALDWLGAIGVARVMALVDPNGADPDGPTEVTMLEDNLKDVPARGALPGRPGPGCAAQGRVAGISRGSRARIGEFSNAVVLANAIVWRYLPRAAPSFR